MLKKINKEIERLEKSLFRSCERLAISFSTKDRNEVIKITLKLQTLKNLINE